MSRLNTFRTASALMAALMLAGCGNETGTKDGDTGEDTSKSTSADGVSRNCQVFYDYMQENCEPTPIQLAVVQTGCNAMDNVFIDSFMEDLTECMMSKECEELTAVIAVEPDTDPDAGTATPFEDCAVAAAVTAEPGEVNLEFQEHYCDYAIECMEEVTSQVECEAAFESFELGVFLVMDEPFIGQADECVNPNPECDNDAVQACIEGVGQSFFGILGQSFN